MDAKKRAAEKAVDMVKEGMVVGLGTGSTAYWAIQLLSEKARHGFGFKAVATSLATEALAKEGGITVVDFETITAIDITIDGADEVDSELNLIKGGGGALLREKIVAGNSKQFVVIVDDTKCVAVLGKFPLAVEIAPFGAPLTVQQLHKSGAEVQLRYKNGQPSETDNGNFIADCYFNAIPDPAALNQQLHLIPGVLETGLFLNTMVTTVIVGYETGEVTMLNR